MLKKCVGGEGHGGREAGGGGGGGAMTKKKQRERDQILISIVYSFIQYQSYGKNILLLLLIIDLENDNLYNCRNWSA